jgi:2-oxo-4-hydroxy-4-carboxy-5-ureidoimidazoline decarboxylase
MLPMRYSLDQLNQMNQTAFTEALGAIFEQTPTIAEQAWLSRPFQDLTDLHEKMVAVVRGMDVAEQYRLIQAHPDLGSKARMAEASVKEQAGAGLSQLSSTEYDRFQQLNQAYRDRFGFPFIIAVRNHTKASILEAFEQRLTHSQEAELQQALNEICQIAHFRLADAVGLSQI